MFEILDVVVIVASVAASSTLLVWTVLDVLMGIEWLSVRRLRTQLVRRLVSWVYRERQDG